MENKDEGKAESFFRDFGKKLDQFFAEAKDASSRVEGDLKKKYEELKTSAEQLKKDARNKERWKEVEDSLKRAGQELEKAAKAAFKKREADAADKDKK
jgi:phosphoglycerate-specific signal transduction histidine kinase